ncbi:MAG: NUDIX hydrolase [Holdemanella sp.]|nr:NUDIX hydrolase [Holdemanella sp.]
MKELLAYIPYNEQEVNDKKIMIEFLKNHEDAYDRSNEIGHMTTSSWIVNADHTKVLMVYHSIYQSFSWTGGHADGNKNLLQVAYKEAMEETGIGYLKILDESIFSIEIIPVSGHMKKGKYISSHLHFNVTYLFEGKEEDALHIKEDENSAVEWIEIKDLKEKVSEPWMMERIYSKLNDKLYTMSEQK